MNFSTEANSKISERMVICRLSVKVPVYESRLVYGKHQLITPRWAHNLSTVVDEQQDQTVKSWTSCSAVEMVECSERSVKEQSCVCLPSVSVCSFVRVGEKSDHGPQAFQRHTMRECLLSCTPIAKHITLLA